MSLRLPGIAAACFLACAVALCGCSIDSSGLASVDAGGLDGSTDGPPPPTDAGPECRTFGSPRVVAVLDREGFAGGELALAQVDEAGHLVLDHERYRHEALLFRAYVDPLLDPGMPSFSVFDGATPDGWAFIGDLDQNIGGDAAPSGFVDTHVNWSMFGEGEMELEPGMHVLTLEGDDVAIAEVTIDGAPQTVTTWLGTGDVRFEVPEPGGWYPFRVGWMDYGADARLRVQHTPPSGGTATVDASRLRASVDDVEGRELWGWDSLPHDDSPDGSRLDTTPSREPNFLPLEYPAGVGITDKNDFALVWAGRHWLPRKFTALAGDANERMRVWVDGRMIGEGRSVALEAPLVEGWYDIVVEYEEAGDATQSIQLLADRGPFQPAEMRPATRFGGRPFGIAATGDETLPPDGTGDKSVTLQAPSDPACAVEVSAIVETEDPERVSVSVTTPGGTALGPYELAPRSYRAPRTFRHHFREVLRGDTVPSATSGTWVVTVQNEAGATDDAIFAGAAVLAHHGCADGPYVDAGTFTSTPVDLGRDHEIQRIVTTTQRPFGGSVRTRVRVGRTLAELEAAVGWLVTDVEGNVDPPLVGRYAQVELQLSGPGHDTPRVVDARIVGAPCLDCVAAGTCREPELGGLVALYTFDETEGRRVRDMSGAGEPLDLFVDDLTAITRGGGALRVNMPTVVRSIDYDRELYELLAASDAMTVETVIVPALASQPVGGTPPARIVTHSLDMTGRNFTLGQELDVFVVRLRTSDGDDQGRAWLLGDPPVAVAPTHVAYTYGPDGALVLYVNGEEQTRISRSGTFDTWDPQLELALANEPDVSRPFLGEYRWVAIYDRVLPAEAIRRNYEALSP